jgi:hypothetical protein
MSRAIRSSELTIASVLSNWPAANEISKARPQLFAKLVVVVGLVLVSATVFVSGEAMLICSAAVKANFCP